MSVTKQKLQMQSRKKNTTNLLISENDPRINRDNKQTNKLTENIICQTTENLEISRKFWEIICNKCR